MFLYWKCTTYLFVNVCYYFFCGCDKIFMQPKKTKNWLTIKKGGDIMKKRKKRRIFISKRVLKHSSRGNFKWINPTAGHSQKAHLRMTGGGHGQENINLLQKIHMPHRIDKIYSNGVRLGSVENHKRGYKSKYCGQAWFPPSWTRSTIAAAGRHVASLKRSEGSGANDRPCGRYRGVTVGIIRRNKKIQTIFPSYDVNKYARRKAHVIFGRSKRPYYKN